MRSSTAYFAGAGTVIAAVVAGLGGGYLFFSIVSPHPEKHGSSEVSRLERRLSAEPIPATNKGATEPVPYLDKPQISAAVADPPAQPQQQQAAQPQQQQAATPPPAQPQQPQPQQAQPQQAPAQQASTQPAAAAPSAPPAPPAAQPVAAAEQPAAREKSTPDDSFARARDGDVRRDARREARQERRKAERERRQQWSERRKWRQRDDDSELVEVERKVREETEPRRFREYSEPRPFFASEPRAEMPRIRLFDMD
jgi:hypothetical protein